MGLDTDEVKQNKKFIQEIFRLLAEEYNILKDSSEWKVILAMVNEIKTVASDYFYYESPSYWAETFNKAILERKNQED